MDPAGASAEDPVRRITLRAIVIAVALTPLNAIYLVTAEVLWGTTSPTSLSLFYNVVFILFWLVAANLLLKRYKPTWALSPSELFVIYTMLSIASALCSIDMLEVLVATLPYLTHFEPIEHQYGKIMPHLPPWLIVKDELAAASFYLGQEAIYSPAIYRPWIRPLSYWFLFVMALLAVMAGLDLVFRKQWTQHEKLAYPIIQVPMQLVNETRNLFYNRAFWAGFAAVAFLDILNGLNYLYPLLPSIPVVHVVNIQSFFPERPWSDMNWTWVSFYPFAIGLCFFMPVDLAFSCWFFYIVFKLQRVAASYFGVHGMPGFPYIEEQTLGGYYALALLALWITRRHLLRMLRLALFLPVENEEPGERKDALLAGVLMGAGLTVLYLFSYFAGMTPWIIVFFFVAYYLLAVAVTRMRAELGYPSHDLHFIGPNFQVVKLIGAPTMQAEYPRDLTMFGFYNFITRAYRAHPMPHGLEAFRIAERNKMNHRLYLAAMGVAAVAGTLAAYFAVLWVFNQYGATSITGVAEFYGYETWTRTQQYFTAPEPHLPQPAYATLLGLLFSLGLAVLRLNLAWWPFHPVGYAVSGSWAMEQLWACFFVAWLVKLLLLKYAGARGYQLAVPLFIGVMLGDFIVGTSWSIFGVLTAQDVYHFWPY
jgi:hypothetical protein